MGISGMMHGYLAFDRDWNLLTPFRTWRNTTTGPAAAELTEAFAVNSPQRWSAARLYQAILNGEPHVSQAAHITTLAGYVHYRLTGINVLGIGDASGMFPIDSDTLTYRPAGLSPQPPVPPAAAPHCGGGRRRPDRRGSGPSGGTPAPRHSVLPPGGGRRNGHDGHQRRGCPDRERIRGHLRLFHGGAGAAPLPGLSGH